MSRARLLFSTALAACALASCGDDGAGGGAAVSDRPAASPDARSLLRRVSYDLTGLLRSVETIAEVYDWAEALAPGSLPADLRWVDGGVGLGRESRRLYADRFYAVALRTEPRTHAAGSLVRMELDGEPRWLVELEYSDVPTLGELRAIFAALADPTRRRLLELLAAEHGVATVVDLRHAGEDRGFDEAGRAAALGLEYVAIPFGSPDELTGDVFDRVRAALRASDPGA